MTLLSKSAEAHYPHAPRSITVRPPSLADLALRSSHPLPGPLKPSQSLAPAEDIQVIIQEVQLLR